MRKEETKNKARASVFNERLSAGSTRPGLVWKAEAITTRESWVSENRWNLVLRELGAWKVTSESFLCPDSRAEYSGTGHVDKRAWSPPTSPHTLKTRGVRVTGTSVLDSVKRGDDLWATDMTWSKWDELIMGDKCPPLPPRYSVKTPVT